jgi:hypothetical protein
MSHVLRISGEVISLDETLSTRHHNKADIVKDVKFLLTSLKLTVPNDISVEFTDRAMTVTLVFPDPVDDLETELAVCPISILVKNECESAGLSEDEIEMVVRTRTVSSIPTPKVPAQATRTQAAPQPKVA